MTDANKYCAKCKKRQTCTEMCAPVNELVNAAGDTYVTKKVSKSFTREFIIYNEPSTNPDDHLINQRKASPQMPQISIKTPAQRKELILRLAIDGKMPQTEIAIHAGCTRQYVTKVIKKCMGLM